MGTATVTLEEALEAHLADLAAVLDLCGGRVYPERPPLTSQLTPQVPCWVTYTQIDGQSDTTYAGPSGLAHARYQIDCWGETYSDAKALATILCRTPENGGINCFRGSLGGLVDVQGVLPEPRRDSSPLPIPGNDHPPRKVSTDWLIWYAEP